MLFYQDVQGVVLQEVEFSRGVQQMSSSSRVSDVLNQPDGVIHWMIWVRPVEGRQPLCLGRVARILPHLDYGLEYLIRRGEHVDPLANAFLLHLG